MSFLEIDTVRFRLDDIGAGVPVVFLHAGVCDRRMWAAQMDAVSKAGFRAIAYDRRGFGETVCDPEESFSSVRDLADILDALDIHAAILVGCSNGGRRSVDFALAHPDRVAGLVLVGTGISGAPWDDIGPASYQQLTTAMETAEELGDLNMLNKVEAHAWLDGPSSNEGRVGGAVRDLFFDMNARALHHPKLTAEETLADAWSRVEDVAQPTLLVGGSLDWLQILQTHDELDARLPNAFAVTIDETAHLPGLERPDLFNPLLLGFLDHLFGEGDEELPPSPHS